MVLQFHNTLTRRKEPFVPRDEGRVGIYLCGPTVYGEPHIGNLRPVVVFDVLRRHLAASGYQVLLVRIQHIAQFLRRDVPVVVHLQPARVLPAEA